MKLFRQTLLILLTVGLLSCSKNPPLLETVTILQTNNKSVKQLEIQLTNSASVQVKLTRLSDDTAFLTFPTSIDDNHKIPLIGLKSDQVYHYQILSEGRKISKPDTFRTDKIPIGIVRLDVQKHTPNSFDGYLLTQRRLVSGSVYMMDNEGEIVWYQDISGQPKTSVWTANGEILVLYGSPQHNNSAGDQIISYRPTGDTSYQINLKKVNLVAHHEIMEYEDDLLLLVYDKKKIKTKNDGEVTVTSSGIVRLSKEGEIRWKWSTFDVKNPKDDPNIVELQEDWGHANAISLDTDGHILISQRDWNQIWKINSVSGELIWTLGENGTIQMDSVDVFSAQHAIYKDINDNYMLFDNGRKNRKSRILSFHIDGRKATSVISIDLPDDLYADRMGNARLLSNENILVCSPRSRSIVIMDKSEEILFHVTVGIPDPYRAEFVPSFYTTVEEK